jgi:hypothetical protein
VVHVIVAVVAPGFAVTAEIVGGVVSTDEVVNTTSTQ